MKSGATYLIAIEGELDVEKVLSVIFTLKGAEKLTKSYPTEVAYDGTNFLIPLTQEETLALGTEHGHKVEVEGQTNFKDNSVDKTGRTSFFLERTLATQIVEGSYPSAYPITEVKLSFRDGVIVADLDPEAFDEKIKEEVWLLTADMQAEIDGKVDKVDGKGLSTNDFTNDEKEKLESIEIGAQKNKVDSVNGKTGSVVLTAQNVGALPDTTTHLSGDIALTQKGSANGVAELDANGKIISSQLPSYVDDVLEFPNVSDFPSKGESGKIYIATQTNLSYRWTGNDYTVISPSIALGETSSTAYRGDLGRVAYLHSTISGNPHMTTKADIGLGNVNNTSDDDKPISFATQKELDKKESIEDSYAKFFELDSKKADKTDLENISTVASTSSKTITDATNGCIYDFVAYGRLTQGADASPSNPQPISYWNGDVKTTGGVETYTASLGTNFYGIVLVGGNDVGSDDVERLADSVNLREGKIYKAFGSRTPVYRGITRSAAYGDFVYCDTTDALTNNVEKLLYHPKFIAVSNNDKTKAEYVNKYRCYIENGRFVFRYPAGVSVTKEMFDADVSGTECIFALANPVEEPMTASQVLSLTNLRTFEGTTELSFYGSDPIFELKYFKKGLGAEVLGDINNRLPFRLGIDSDGNYGYYKAGADSVTPFKSGGGCSLAYRLKTFNITGEYASISSFNLSTYEENTVWFKNMQTVDGYDFGEFRVDYGVTTGGMYTLRATKPCTIRYRNNSNPTFTERSLNTGDVCPLFSYNDTLGEAYLSF